GHLGTGEGARRGDCCTGSSAACPTDAKQPSGTACADDGNPCTTDTCDGTSDTCQHPAGNAGTECRAAAGDCDVAEVCDGTNTACPADGFKDQTTVCRAAAGDCDVAETCTGSSAACPADDSLVSRALGKSGRAHKRLLKSAIAKLRQAIKLVNKAEGRNKNPISSNCASPIRDVLTDALNRLLTLT